MKLIMLVTLGFVLTGCASISPYVQTSSTTFQGQEHFGRGTISVIPFDKSQEGTLEFQSVSNYLLRKLAESGYTPVQTGSQSTYVAYITYGIDSGKTTMSSAPLFGQTGGGTSFSSGSVSSGTRTGSYSGTTTTMPTYGVIGVMPVSGSEYKRAVNIDVFKRTNTTPIKVYEMKAISTGSCGNINSILFSIIDGMFKNFPGENGKTKRENIKWDGQC
jgi:hypothetical protein